MIIKTVTVIGANGTMGRNISAIFASFGNAKVYLVSRSLEKSKTAVSLAAKSVKADSIKSSLIPADYSMLKQCIAESDLVFESVKEDLLTKCEINRQIAEYVKADAVICSGTSGLSITSLADEFPVKLRSRYLGIHMYNPPYNMLLCEVIPTVYTDQNLLIEVKQYLREILIRTVVEVKDKPAFLGNRIGFQFINEALQYAEKYKYNGGIDYIDAIIGPFTGRNMAPLNTSDFVGLDVHKAIVDNLYDNTNDYAHETFVLPQFAQQLIASGKLGRKTKGGLYKMEKYDNGLKRFTVYDIETGSYRDKFNYSFPFAETMICSLKTGDYELALATLINNRSSEAELCLEFVLKYIIYALNSVYEVGYNIHDADDVMATGYGWCPPLALIQAISLVCDFEALVKERISAEILEKIDFERIIKDICPSHYDFRPYFKSAR